MNTALVGKHKQTHGCERFVKGTRLREICEGAPDLPLKQINRYRERWGLPPLSEDDIPPRQIPVRSTSVSYRKSESPTKRRSSSGESGCSGCGGSRQQQPPRLNGAGPGSKLLEDFAQAGVPHCDKCLELAARMDAWGKRGCEDHLHEIVEDILPRAREWMADNHQITHSLLGLLSAEDTALRVAIGRKVRKAIDSATPAAGQQSQRAIKAKEARRQTKSKAVHHPVDYSNLLESTAIGEPTWTKGSHPKVERIPFVGEPVRNLIYHVYPLRGSDVWRWNLDMLMSRIVLFNGRRIVAIAVGDETESAEVVKDRLGSEVVEYMVFRNNKHIGEMSSFVPLLAQVESDDPNQVTFRAHTKCVDRCRREKKPHLRDWVEMLYRTSLEDWPLVRKHLEVAAMTGSCRKFDQFNKRRPINKPSYSGTFYWFRNCFVYSREWYTVDSPRWGCESWPAKMFTKEETRCICLDNTNSMYSATYWESTVKPTYDKWLKKRGLVR